VEATADAARARLVADWFKAGDPAGAVMIAHRRADVADLNARAREGMRQAGALGPELETRAGCFAVGDHVVVKRNDLRRGIHNGDRAHVIGIDPARREIDIERGGRRIRLDQRFLAERPPPATRRSCTAMRSRATSPKASPSTTPTSRHDGIDREWPTSPSAAAATPTASTSPHSPTKTAPNTHRSAHRGEIRSSGSPPA